MHNPYNIRYKTPRSKKIKDNKENQLSSLRYPSHARGFINLFFAAGIFPMQNKIVIAISPFWPHRTNLKFALIKFKLLELNCQ